jgi:predicted RNase H-like HicB family nuclease
VDLTVQVCEEGQGYWAHVVELPGCFASGRSLDELRAALGESIGLYLWNRPVSIGQQPLRVGNVAIEVEEPDGS